MSEAENSSTTPADLLKIKEKFGPSNPETISADSWPELSFKLGQRFKDEIHAEIDSSRTKKEIRAKIPGSESKKYKDKKEPTLACAKFMENRARDLAESNPQLSSAITTYLECIKQWARGADITYENALILQNDEVGCYSPVVRGDDGSVVFGHLEQYDEDKFNNPNLFTVKVGSEIRTSLIYPFIFPGNALTIFDSRVITSDFLYLKPGKPGFLSNSAMSIMLMLGEKVDMLDTLFQLSPYHDGYAITEMYYDEKGNPQARKIIFAHNKIDVKYLGPNSGDFLWQSNRVPKDSPASVHVSKIDSEEDEYYDLQEVTSTKIYEAIKTRNTRHRGVPFTEDSMRKILGFHGDIWPLSDKWVKSTTVGKFSKEGKITVQHELGPVVTGRHDPARSPDTNNQTTRIIK